MASDKSKCDPVSIRLETEDFRLWYTRFKDVISDLSLVRRVSSIAYNLLNQGCSKEEVIKVIEEILRSVDIDPLSVRRGEFQGLRGDVIEVLREVFPNAVQETKPPFFLGEEASKGRPIKQGPQVVKQVRRVTRRRLGIRGLELGSWVMVAVSLALSALSVVLGGRLMLSIGLSLMFIFLIVALMARIHMI